MNEVWAVLATIKGTLVKVVRSFWRYGGTRYEDIEGRVTRIEGLLVPGQEKWLFEAARGLPDGANLVEIGCYKGRSTTCLAFACVGSKKHLYTIDTFNGNAVDFDVANRNDFFKVWQDNVGRNGLLAHVTALMGLSSQVAKSWNKPIDFLFIDGSHEYEDVLADFMNYYPHVVPGGVVAMHDVEPGHPGCQRVWDELAQSRLVGTGHLSTLAFGRKPLRDSVEVGPRDGK